MFKKTQVTCLEKSGPHRWGKWEHKDKEGKVEEIYTGVYGASTVRKYMATITSSRRYCDLCNELEERVSRTDVKAI